MPNIVVPELGESVVEARVAKWLKKEGDVVAAGEPLVELETEKIDLEVSADRAGVLESIKHQEGADVKVGEVLAVLGAHDGAAQPPQGASLADSSTVAQGAKVEARSAEAGAAQASDVRATPTARNVAKAHDVKLESVTPTGTRVTKDDVLRATSPKPVAETGAKPAPKPAAEAKTTQPAKAGDRSETRERMTKRRATIARRLVEAQRTAAMLTTFNEVDMSAVMALRERRKEAFSKKHGVGLGIASFFVKAAVGALKAFPAINAEIQGDEVVYKHYYDVGMAVGAEGGLVVPVLRDASEMSFAQIELAIRDFAKRAGDGTLTLEDLKGGTFTITNGGVFGSLMSTPILNPPQVGILGLHKIADRPTVVGGQVVVRPMMYVALSYDHRLVDGREAVQFLVKIKEYIEDPAFLLVEG
ncbi:MAG: 2-oxoglutarate dehydrogenase complex dihydrolipoyllysine-residue succinyltransferase [Acidobacteria bacterium]|nr:2-oxoglutarate dehydrogenase complex dihydrolipoyllysine-residue succinyltransferase [Acidobacteriota bacterium]